jgi:hypothetical protein
MPVYEFECDHTETCGHKFQVLYRWRTADGINILDDPEQQDCPECGEHASQLWSLTTMRPDRFWAGFYDDRLDKYWTSESRFNKHLKENDLAFIGDRTDRESLTKIAEEGIKSKDRKAEKMVEKTIIEELAWKDEYGDYGTVKQRNKKARERARLESECPADVFEDPAFK